MSQPLQRRPAQPDAPPRRRSLICCALIVIAVEWWVGGHMADRIQNPKLTPSVETLVVNSILGAIAMTGEVLQWKLHRVGG